LEAEDRSGERLAPLEPPPDADQADEMDAATDYGALAAEWPVL
jgi:hypothetical protein